MHICMHTEKTQKQGVCFYIGYRGMSVCVFVCIYVCILREDSEAGASVSILDIEVCLVCLYAYMYAYQENTKKQVRMFSYIVIEVCMSV